MSDDEQRTRYDGEIAHRATEFLTLESYLALGNLEQNIEASHRLAEIAIRMADEATKTVTVQPVTRAA